MKKLSTIILTAFMAIFLTSTAHAYTVINTTSGQIEEVTETIDSKTLIK